MKRSFTTQQADPSASQPPPPKEKVFDYSTMDYYQLLEVFPNATEVQMKKSYLRLAKKYHPDLYHGANPDHFKKVLEAYQTLKNPIKRSDYDKHQRIKTMKSKDYEEYERKMKEQGQDFSHEMYEEMKRQAQQGKTVREKIDPEFEEAFKKLNVNRLYQEFLARPMQSQPDELHGQIMQSSLQANMSKRDKARMQFVKQYRKNQQIKRSIKNQIIMETEKIKDFQDGLTRTKKMTYKELVEDFNQDIKAIEQMEKPLVLFNEEKAMVEQIIKEQDKTLKQAKIIIYPIWAVIIAINSLLIIGYYYQEKTMAKDEKKMKLIEKFSNYKYA